MIAEFLFVVNVMPFVMLVRAVVSCFSFFPERALCLLQAVNMDTATRWHQVQVR